MFVKAIRSEKGGNTGSCSGLVAYLEKENQDLQPGQEPELWFNSERRDIGPQEVQNHIDNNKKGLAGTAAKFFEIDIAPSSRELHHLEKLAGGDQNKMKELLKDYVGQQVMEQYARAAGKRGPVYNPRELTAADITWYGKVEQNRYYKFNDPEVRDGAAQKGEIREGRHMHVQVIVSAKTQDQQLAISPLSNEHAGSIGKIKGREVYKGFSRNQFKEGSEKAWDKTMGYDRNLTESFEYHKTMKTGTLEQKEVMQQQAYLEGQQRRLQAQQKKEVAPVKNEEQHVSFQVQALDPTRQTSELQMEFEQEPKRQVQSLEQNHRLRKRRGPHL